MSAVLMAPDRKNLQIARLRGGAGRTRTNHQSVMEHGSSPTNSPGRTPIQIAARTRSAMSAFPALLGDQRKCPGRCQTTQTFIVFQSVSYARCQFSRRYTLRRDHLVLRLASAGAPLRVPCAENLPFKSRGYKFCMRSVTSVNAG